MCRPSPSFQDVDDQRVGIQPDQSHSREQLLLWSMTCLCRPVVKSMKRSVQTATTFQHLAAEVTLVCSNHGER